MRRTKYIYVGATASRPHLTLDDIGYEFYDITLKKPIWWNGENWTDATGAILTEDNIIPQVLNKINHKQTLLVTKELLNIYSIKKLKNYIDNNKIDGNITEDMELIYKIGVLRKDKNYFKKIITNISVYQKINNNLKANDIIDFMMDSKEIYVDAHKKIYVGLLIYCCKEFNNYKLKYTQTNNLRFIKAQLIVKTLIDNIRLQKTNINNEKLNELLITVNHTINELNIPSLSKIKNIKELSLYVQCIFNIQYAKRQKNTYIATSIKDIPYKRLIK